VWNASPITTRFIREKKIRVYFADMVQIARDVASVADLQMRMQGIVLLGAFSAHSLPNERHDRRPGLCRRRKGHPQILWQAGDRVVKTA
jgi:hypothetical protein